MSQVDELLDELSGGDITTYSANPETEPHIVVSKNRVITVPEELKQIAVQNDHNIETVTFDCPRYWDGHDLYAMKTYIHYKTSGGIIGKYLAQNVAVDDNDTSIFHFTWTISNNVTGSAGPITFLVCVKDVDEMTGEERHHWNSKPNSDLTVSPGLDCDDETFESGNSDIITQLLLRMDETEELVKAADLDEVAGLYEETQALVESTKVSVTRLETEFEGIRFATASDIYATVVSNGISAVFTVERLSFTEPIDGVLRMPLATLPAEQCPLTKMEFVLPEIAATSTGIDFVSFIIDVDGSIDIRMAGAGSPCEYALGNLSASFAYPLSRIIVGN